MLIFKRKIQGFTLLEMLVVLIITSMLTALLFQGLSYVLHLRERFLVQLDRLQQGAIKAHWFRDSVTALIPHYANGEHLFKGNSKEFSGLTIAGLDSHNGIPTAFSWKIQQDKQKTTLYYQQPPHAEWAVMSWRGEIGQFRYLGINGQWYEEYPPKSLDMNSNSDIPPEIQAMLGLKPQVVETPQLPRAISLSGTEDLKPFTWIIPIQARDNPKIDLNVILKDW